MMKLLDYLEAKEKHYKIDDATMRQYTDALKSEKQRVGSVETEAPNFDDIPLVILRKLARDGHFWDLLSMHPIVKVAKETVTHIATRDRAMVVAWWASAGRCSRRCAPGSHSWATRARRRACRWNTWPT
jgi:hypothetical protein